MRLGVQQLGPVATPIAQKEGNLAGRPLLPNIILISIYFSHNKLKAIHADVTLCINIGQLEVETVDTLID